MGIRANCSLREGPCSAQLRLALPRMLFDSSRLGEAGSGGIRLFCAGFAPSEKQPIRKGGGRGLWGCSGK